jgi:hypothetical protein
MKKAFYFLMVSVFAGALVFGPAPSPITAATLVWQTTFNCNDWNEKMGLLDANVCAVGDGISGAGGWATSGHPNGDEITVAANNPAGAGGKGFRHWRGDGQNNNGGGLSINLPAPLPELWVRWYMRYQQGFTWAGGGPQYTKELYFNVDGRAPQHAVGFKGADSFGTTQFFPVSRNIDGGPGWLSGQHGSTGDGLFHVYEIHMKRDTNGVNGVWEAWIDGTRAVLATDVNWGGATFSWFVLGDNQYNPANGGDRYTDYDDLAVSATGYIGPIGGGTPTAPLAPANLRIVK